MKRLVVAAALLREQWRSQGPSRILVTKRGRGVHLEGSWEFPGGKVEPNEPPADALVRELREELGVDITVGDIYAVGHHVYQSREVILLVYEAVIVSGELQRLGVADFQWMAPLDVIELELPPADAPVIERLRREMSP
ncbi:MAG: (deoxy)nucleoside triphosphate pyrophosphohydrolase [Myxococcota bacterium]|nr:(deoxy)nucleoside triphosphate pyrophosphohydrolase [Myxococcota bacterium]